MTRDDIIRMAREAQSVHATETWTFALSANQLEHFAALVAAAERKACAKVCDGVHARHIAEHGDYIGKTYATECADAILKVRME